MNARRWTTATLLAIAGITVVPDARGQTTDDDPSFHSYQAHLAAAEKFQLDQSRAARWLDAAPPEHRGWEWDYLDAVSDTSRRTIPTDATPIRIAISPDGSTIATVDGAVVHLWSWPSLEPGLVVRGHTDAIYRAEFGPDGTRLVTVARDVTSRVWDVGTGAEIARIDLANPAFAAATFSPDGHTAATCAWERVDGEVYGLVWIWDASTGEIRARRRLGIKPLSSIRYTPDGRRLLVGSWDGLVHVLGPDAIEVRTLTMPDDDVYNAVNEIAVSPDGGVVAAAAKDSTVRVFDLATGALEATLRGHSGYVEGLAFSPDGELLASTAADDTARLWRTSDWTATGVLRGHAATVRGAVWTPAGDEIITCSRDDTLRIWDRDRLYAPQLDIDAGVDGTYSSAFSPDDRTIAVACFDGRLRMYDSRTGKPTASWVAHPDSTCHDAAYGGDGSLLITSSWDETARVWRLGDLASGRPIEPAAVLEAGSGVRTAVLSPDGARSAVAAQELQIWDVASVTRLHTISVEDAQAIGLAYSRDGSRLATGWSDGIARLVDVESGRVLATMEGHTGAVSAVAYTADSSGVVTGDAAGVVRLFPAGGGKCLFACDTGERGVNHVAVMGDRIAAATDRLWIIDLERGGPVLERRPHTDTVWSLSWSTDGARLATCSTNGTIAVLDARRATRHGP